MGKAQTTRLDATPTSATHGIRGAITLSDDVVATIGALAARDIPGIFQIGRSRFIEFGNMSRRGVAAEVGEKQAALDVDLIVEYDCDIETIASDLRSRIAREVKQMTGRDVVEINLNVVGVHVPETPKREAGGRVQ